ncbi:TIGR02556 family CRISPR-associated protein [Bacillota bacterium LX-D]|nr:TIGR02556 family CRISPR-associated protein [Bacillota bacterium LX-D]
MIEAIKNIGEIELAHLRANQGTILDIFTADPSDGGKYGKVLFIKLSKKGDSYRYNGIEDRGYRSEAIGRYLYRSGTGARGADVTPTAKLTEASKTVPNKIIRAVNDALSFAGKKHDEEKGELEKVKLVLEAEEKQIIADIQEKQKQLGKEGTKVIISLMIAEDGEEKWVGDWNIFRDKFKADCEKLFSEKYGKVAASENKICAVCLEKKEVYGFASTFQFYTLDKPGYVAGGFRQQDAWKNYPVCFNCGTQLELGKKYVERHLTKSFYNRQLMIIPKTLWIEDLQLVLKSLEARLTPKQEDSGTVKKKQSEVESIRFAEENIIDSLGSIGQQVTYNFMFFEEKQSGAVFNILLNIEDVLPSRLNYIYSKLKEVNSMNQFKNFPVGKGEQSFRLHLGIFNELFPYKTHNRYFLESIYSLIADKPINAHFLLTRLMEKISEQFKRPDNEEKKFYDNFIAWRYFQLITYLGRLGLLPDLLKNGGEKPVNESSKYNLKDFPSVEAMFDAFFANQNGLYDHPGAKACFMVGYLSQHLINFQRKALGRMPFKIQMKGLALKEKDIRDLYRKLQAKFLDYVEAYEKEFYPCSMEFELLTKYIQAAGKDWRLTMQEVGFFVAVGMNGKNLFNFAKEGKEDE